jgi:hypothetical protein
LTNAQAARDWGPHPNPIQLREASHSRWPGAYHVVDLHDAADGLCGQRDGARRHEQRLDDVLGKHVADTALCQWMYHVGQEVEVVVLIVEFRALISDVFSNERF